MALQVKEGATLADYFSIIHPFPQLLAGAYLYSEAIGLFGTHGILARVAEVAVFVLALSILWAVAQWTLLALIWGSASEWGWDWLIPRTVLQPLGTVLHCW